MEFNDLPEGSGSTMTNLQLGRGEGCNGRGGDGERGGMREEEVTGERGGGDR